MQGRGAGEPGAISEDCPPGGPGPSAGGGDGPTDPEPCREMGNASLCPSCHAGKSVKAQGHLQEADRAPDYYGCPSEDAPELGARVSAEQTQREDEPEVLVDLSGQIPGSPGRK